MIRDLEHPNIVPYFGTFETGSYIVIIMQYIDGKPILDLSSQEKIPAAKRRYLMSQLLGILSYLKNKRVVHRDIKPDNILVGKDLKLTLLDFGVSCLMCDLEGTTSKRVGTLGYVAPEILL